MAYGLRATHGEIELANPKKIAVIGTGTMGIQISQVIALNGFNVVLKSRTENSLECGLKRIKENLQRSVNEKRLTREQANETMARITGTTRFLKAGKNADIVIESIIEDMEEKKSVFKEMAKVCPSYTIFSSNTSSLSISELATSVETPQRVIGLHFFNPAAVIKLVEITKGRVTSPENVNVIRDFVGNLNKIPIVINDSPGFLVNRMLIPMINEAISILEEGVASKEDIDSSMKLGAKHPMGPLELADLIGLDVCLSIMESLFKQFNNPKYRPCPLMLKMVQKNYLGRKTKRGFYEY
jgi:3-hydroxybutyryl-CoA dehydrogenase